MSEARERVRNRREWPVAVTWEDRVADRVDPVLAGDVLAAAGNPLSRAALGITMLAALSFVMNSGDASIGRVRAALLVPLIVGRGLLLGVLPLRTFLTTRADLDAGTREHLLLAGLDPLQIVRGRIGGGVTLGMLVLGLLAPCVALACGLRGLPIHAGLWLLAVTVLLTITAQAIATGLAAATRHVEPRAVPLVVAAVIFASTGVSDATTADATLGLVLATTAEGAVATLAFAVLLNGTLTAGAVLIAIAALRPDERSTTPAFRWLALATPLVLAVADLIHPGALPPVATPTTPGLLAVAWVGFIGVTAIDRPAGGARHPFRDGPDRAVVWTLLAAAVVEAAAAIVARGLPPAATHLGVALLVGYVLLARLVAASVGGGARLGRLRRARTRAALAAGGLLFAPRVWNGLIGAPSDAWTALRVVDPWAAAERLGRDGVDAIPWLGLFAGLVALAAAWVAVAVTAARRDPAEPEATR